MLARSRRPLAAPALLAAALVALALPPLSPAAAQQGRMDETNNPADAAFIAAMRDLMVGMHKAMPTGDTDRDFVRMMLPHSQSALDMAKAEVRYGQDPELKTLAQAMLDNQSRELALMKAWEDKHPR